MYGAKRDIANRQIRIVTYVGVVVNVVLAGVKFAVGFSAGSMALLADGVHSLSDTATDFAVLLGIHFGSKAPDPEHPYGHGRIETFASLFIAVVLVVVGGVMIFRASMSIAAGQSQANAVAVGPAVFWAALLSVFVKEALYQLTKKTAVKVHSTALYANAWHHRSDALSSIVVLIGFVSLRFGYVYGDQIATVAVGLMIILVAVKIVRGCLDEFAERAVDSATMERIKQIIDSEDRICQWHNLRTRSAGREIFIDLHILVDGELNISNAHEIAEELEETLHARMTRPVNITIHVEPDRPELRK